MLRQFFGVLHGRVVDFVVACAVSGGVLITLAVAEEAKQSEPLKVAAATSVDTPTTDDDAETPAPPKKLAEPKGAHRLSPDYDVWIDAERKAVLIDGQISLREGMLEMFACTRNTKEHESVVSANTKAYLVHAALLRLGAEAGHPVRWVPKYVPPTGSEIDVQVYWIDEKGKEKTVRAQEWVKDARTKKSMEHPWVFAGSQFWTDEETGKQYYQAEGGDFICVSNFGTAMLDIPIPSSQSNEELAFEAFTEHIPPLGAPVRLILTPLTKERAARNAEPRGPFSQPAEK